MYIRIDHCWCTFRDFVAAGLISKYNTFFWKKIQRNVEPDLDQGEDGSHMGSQRLKDIECELGEQKKSTAKITKLCLAAIKVF